jgi:N-acylglucosamine 2-epimerase
VDADGRDEVGWKFADAKLWWPHTEALYATLLAHEHTGEAWAMDWHEKVRRYSFSHYPVAGHGEWTQRLDRRGRPMSEVVALPVKDPFHLPRALIYCIDVLERLAGKPPGRE